MIAIHNKDDSKSHSSGIQKRTAIKTRGIIKINERSMFQSFCRISTFNVFSMNGKYFYLLVDVVDNCHLIRKYTKYIEKIVARTKPMITILERTGLYFKSGNTA